MTRGSRYRLRGHAAVLAIPLAGLLLAGCFNPFDPLVAKNRVGTSDPPPYPAQPDLVIRLFEWCWDHRAIAEYEEIFTEDFLFQFADTDSSGNQFLGRVLTRVDEIETARHLFVGGGASPPANSISLELGRNLLVQPDTRPGKNSTYHREIRTDVVLRIETDEEDFQVTGTARFFVVRGDSAVIPRELISRGFTQDPGRWWIERWEDETVGPTTGAFSVVRTRNEVGEAAAPAAPAAPAAATRSAADSRRSPGRESASTVGPLPVTWGFVKAVFRPER